MTRTCGRWRGTGEGRRLHDGRRKAADGGRLHGGERRSHSGEGVRPANSRGVTEHPALKHTPAVLAEHPFPRLPCNRSPYYPPPPSVCQRPLTSGPISLLYGPELYHSNHLRPNIPSLRAGTTLCQLPPAQKDLDPGRRKDIRNGKINRAAE